MTTFDALPVELQREVFEWASVDSERPVNTAMTLSYVCHRVKIWMDYIIYRSIFLEYEADFYRFLDTFNAKPADFFRDRVYSLGIYISEDDYCREGIAEDIMRIFQTCSNLRSVWWLHHAPTNGQLPTLNFVAEHSHLQSGLFMGHEVTVALASQLSFHPWRQSLRILDIDVEHALDVDFRNFPNLTILSIWSEQFTSLWEDTAKTLNQILDQIPLLECLVLGFDGLHDDYDLKKPENLFDLRSDLEKNVELGDFQDPRVVALPCLTSDLWKEEPVVGGLIGIWPGRSLKSRDRQSVLDSPSNFWLAPSLDNY
ncbi:hypothetical protein D9758_010028 [Tetrapyrgos nigripes]|uniref:F-box domain-containing protein n=1 Tax=Tetrapyrgos nigripes TaxID=182062 RepID=A0A8H5FTD1_9AGAR|nr:hypothetical protein D9758_010028 [Tetrapyrgos nigripes]